MNKLSHYSIAEIIRRTITGTDDMRIRQGAAMVAHELADVLYVSKGPKEDFLTACGANTDGGNIDPLSGKSYAD